MLSQNKEREDTQQPAAATAATTTPKNTVY